MNEQDLIRTLKAGLILLAAIQMRIADKCNADFRGENARDLKRAEECFDQVYRNLPPAGGLA